MKTRQIKKLLKTNIFRYLPVFFSCVTIMDLLGNLYTHCVLCRIWQHDVLKKQKKKNSRWKWKEPNQCKNKYSDAATYYHIPVCTHMGSMMWDITATCGPRIVVPFPFMPMQERCQATESSFLPTRFLSLVTSKPQRLQHIRALHTLQRHIELLTTSWAHTKSPHKLIILRKM